MENDNIIQIRRRCFVLLIEQNDISLLVDSIDANESTEAVILKIVSPEADFDGENL